MSAKCHLVFKVARLSQTLHESYVLSMAQCDSSALFNLYAQLAPSALFRLLQRQIGVSVHNGIYSARLVIWMMMDQRLHPRGTLARSWNSWCKGGLTRC